MGIQAKRLSFKTVTSLVLLCIALVTLYSIVKYGQSDKPTSPEPSKEKSIFDDASDNVTGFPGMIVPNIVHLVHFGKPELSFVEIVTIKSTFSNQKPDRIIIHCDCYELSGKYWDMVKEMEILEVRFKAVPTHIFGKKLNSVHHASDIARMEILMVYGGIYLDMDVYVVSSLDQYRKFEFTIGWPMNAYLGTQVLLAHRDARFLRLWYDSYRDYHPKLWYYNAGELPTKKFLHLRPNLVHRVERDFGVHDVTKMLYAQKTDEWKTFKAIHLLIRHRHYLVPKELPKDIDEVNVRTLNRTYGAMVRILFYGSPELLN